LGETAFGQIASVNAVVSAALAIMTLSLLPITPAYADGDSPFDPPHERNSHKSAAAEAASLVKPGADKVAVSKELCSRGLTESNNKNYSAAVDYYNEAIKLRPEYGEALGNRGAARFNLKDYNGALSDYKASLKIFPNNQALKDLVVQVEGVMRENANGQNEAARQANNIRMRSVLGGDMADPSTIIMMNAERRGLIQEPAVDYSDPASIIMMNARRRGLIPANTPNP
jgi:tetratricopeptide (TPR) repeat protein